MTPEGIQFLVTQGLAVFLVIVGGLWLVRVVVPKYLEGIKSEVHQSGEEVNKRLDEQTDALELLSALTLHNMEQGMTQKEFEEKLVLIRSMRRRANGH